MRSYPIAQRELSYPTTLAFLSWTDPFMLHTDASLVGTGAVVTHVIRANELTIAFASHRFSKTDFNRSPTEREWMAVLYAILHFRQYPGGRRFTLIIYCSALTRIFRSRDLNPRLYRWALPL